MSNANNKQPDSLPVGIAIANFLQRNRKYFLYLIVGILVAAAGIITYVLVTQSIDDRAAGMAETAQKSYEEYQTADAEKKDEIEKTLRDELDTVIDKYPGTYGAQRALFIRGTLETLKENWNEAANDYLTLAKRFKKSYLAPVSYFNAAVSFENTGNIDEAIGAYKAVVDGYGKTSIQASHALFSLGRLSEQKGDVPAASEYYRKLTTDYPETNWSSLGSNRLIYLASQGEAQ